MNSCNRHIPAVSIGLPVYNGGCYLRIAIDSLLNQTFQDFELIISDNDSTDSTCLIAMEFQRLDSRVRYIRQERNIGAGANFLFVFMEARAKLFMWASHDDIWAENWLEILTKNISEKDIGIRGEIWLLRNESIVARKLLPNFKRGAFVRCFLGNENNYRSHYAYSLFSREKLLSIDFGAYGLDYYPDAIFVYCLLAQGALRTISGTHICYRLHNKNLGLEYSAPWKGWRKIVYRIHPFRYYKYYLRYTEGKLTQIIIAALIPVKHLYAQGSFWIRGLRELITRHQVL